MRVASDSPDSRKRRLDFRSMSVSGLDDISLVVPTYNRGTALRANLDSMLAMRDIVEIVVVNDGSTDDTVRVCKEFQNERLQIGRASCRERV